MSDFKLDICNSSLLSTVTDSVCDLVQTYNRVLSDIGNIHTPLKQKTIIVCPSAAWYTAEIDTEKCKKRKLERQYNTSLSSVNYINFENQYQHVQNLLLTTRQSYYSKQIEEHSGNPKMKHRVINKVLHHSSDPEYPTHGCPEELTNRFTDCFNDKIRKIKMDIEHLQQSHFPVTDDFQSDAVLSDFKTPE